MASQQQQLEELLKKYEADISSAFLAAIAAIKSDVIIGNIIAALEAGNIEAAVNQIAIDRTVFNPMIEAISQAFIDGGGAAASALPRLPDDMGRKITIRFDARNPRAERWISEKSSTMITNIIEDQRTVIRAALTSGMEQGLNPRTVALDIVGRISSVTKRREGGLLGLTTQQASFVANARRELQSDDPKLLKAYLQRERRDKRFDGAVLKAINGGEPLSQDRISRMLARYEDKLLKLRGDTIGRTEALEALNTAQQESMEQTLDKTRFTEQDVTRVWRCTKDKRTRDSHYAMNGQTVKGLQTPFTTPDGYKLKHPGDSSLGAPAGETINCRCIQFIRLNYLKNLT